MAWFETREQKRQREEEQRRRWEREARQREQEELRREAESRKQDRRSLWGRIPKIRTCSNSSCRMSLPTWMVCCPKCKCSAPAECFVSRDGGHWQEYNFIEYDNQHEQVIDHSRRALTEPAKQAVTVEQITERFNLLLALPDYPGLGNAALELLMLWPVTTERNEITQLLEQMLPQLIIHQFGIPKGLTYSRPHRDRFLPAQHRGEWRADNFVQMVIEAHVLGATWETLPYPHNQLVAFYKLMAEEQRKAIESAVTQWKAHPKPQPPTKDIADEILRLQKLGFSPEAIAEELAASLEPPMKTHERNGHIPPLTPSQFKELPS